MTALSTDLTPEDTETTYLDGANRVAAAALGIVVSGKGSWTAAVLTHSAVPVLACHSERGSSAMPMRWTCRFRRLRSPRAVETASPKIESTLDIAALCKMADRRRITSGNLDGPLTFDNAVSEEAAETKGTAQRPERGDLI